MKEKKIELTDAEWIGLLDAESDDSTLPMCCGVVSELRSSIGYLARNGRIFNEGNARMFAERYATFLQYHGLDELKNPEPLSKLARQAQEFLAS